jgi:hypothetical protein
MGWSIDGWMDGWIECGNGDGDVEVEVEVEAVCKYSCMHKLVVLVRIHSYSTISISIPISISIITSAPPPRSKDSITKLENNAVLPLSRMLFLEVWALKTEDVWCRKCWLGNGAVFVVVNGMKWNEMTWNDSIFYFFATSWVAIWDRWL